MIYRFQVNVCGKEFSHTENCGCKANAMERARKILAEIKRDYHTDYAQITVHEVSYEFVVSYC